MSSTVSSIINLPADAPYLLGTAAPANIRRTRPIKVYTHPILSHHKGAARGYFVASRESFTPETPKQVVVFTPLEPATDTPFIYPRPSYSALVIAYLSSHAGPQTESSLLSILPAGSSFRDVMYRLLKGGKVIRAGSGAYSLTGAR